MFALAYWHAPFLGEVGDSYVFSNGEFLRWLHSVVFVSLLIVCSVIDLRLMIIPDVISIPMILVSPLIGWFHPSLDIKSSLIGVVVGGAVPYAIAWLYWVIRKQYGLGFGDVKLLAAIGGWLGYQAIFPTLFVGAMSGSVVGIGVLIFARRFSWKAHIPFGPFLAFGAVMFLWYAGPIFESIAVMRGE
jgi:leader peptidase (prepilin peptidase)/N-methyltransferase